jgi:hypothetical protein
VEAVLELPEGASRRYTARSPWKSQPEARPFELQAGRAHVIRLAPFEVLTLELTG